MTNLWIGRDIAGYFLAISSKKPKYYREEKVYDGMDDYQELSPSIFGILGIKLTNPSCKRIEVKIWDAKE